MNSKTLRNVSIVIAIVIVVTLIAYPLIFNPDDNSTDLPPVELEKGE